MIRGRVTGVQRRPGDMYQHVDVDFVRDWLDEFGRSVDRQQATLTRLDATLGDGDLGADLHRGVGQARVELARTEAADLKAALDVVGSTLGTSCAGVTGRLYGTFFLRLGTFAARSATLDAAAMAFGLCLARDSVAAVSRAALGDKTLCDALGPAVEAMDAAVYGGLSLAEALKRAALAAEDGRDATRRMVARRGRAVGLGTRSVGHADPGAASTALLIRAAADTAAGDHGVRE